jgi:hypothetical protein
LVKAAAPLAPPAPEEELEVNEAAEEPEEELEVNEAAEEEAQEESKATVPASELAVPEGQDPFEGLDIPPKLQENLRGELSRKERILWVGRPELKAYLGRLWIAVAAGLVFLSIGVGMSIAGFRFKEWEVRLILFGFGGLFSLVGLAATMTRYLIGRYAAWRPCYLVTNRRALVCEPVFSRLNSRGFTGVQLLKMKRVEYSAWPSCGDLVFAGGCLADNSTHPNGFTLIANVRKVEKLIHETLVDRLTDKLVN